MSTAQFFPVSFRLPFTIAGISPGKIRLLLLLQMLFLFSAGCQNISSHQVQTDLSETDVNAELIKSLSALEDFGPRPVLQNQQEIHALPQYVIDDFMAFMEAPEKAGVKANMRMYDYLEIFIEDFVYEGQTFTAAETVAFEGGNCMSLAVFTTALADLAGLEIDYQLMDDVPVYQINGTLVKKGLHIRTIIFEPADTVSENIPSFLRPRIIVDYFPTNKQRFVSNMDRQDYMATYFQNLAVEALEAGQINSAFWHAMESLHYVDNFPSTLNTLAIITRRAGNPEIAEKIYRHGIAHADDKLSLMKNYVVLLNASERFEEAQAIQTQIDQQDDPSPYHWFQLAKTTYENEEYAEAIRYYRRALKNAPYLHEAYLGIAQANYELGLFGDSRLALQSAIEEADRISIRSLYQAKLESLTRQSDI